MKNFALISPPVILSLLFVVACGDGSADPAGSTEEYECYENADCEGDAECSGGTCFAIARCAQDVDCGANASCLNAVCRTHCTTDRGCASTNGTCNTELNLCMPGANPNPTGPGDGDAPGDGDLSGDGDLPGDGDGDGTGDGDVTAPPEPVVDVIDDLLDGDQRILEAQGRIGYWYDYSDAGSSRPLASAPTMEAGRMGIHAVGSHAGGITADEAYGGLGVELNNPTNTDPIPHGAGRSTYDASAWDGFQFWIKSGGSGGTKSIRFELVTTAIAGTEEGGACTGEGCWDSFGRDISLTTEWKLVKVPFSALVQEGWGATKSFDPATILGVAFEDRTTSPWDFWVGEIALYEEPEGTDPTTPTPGSCSGGWGGYNDGSITKYWFTQGTVDFGDINCSYGISNVGSEAGGDSVNRVSTGGGSYFGAMNTADYNTAAACGACVEVTADNGKSVVITIADQCPIGSNPLCVAGHIDLSVDAYNALGLPVGHYGKGAEGQVSWEYVPCPTTGGIQLRLKEPENQYWNMVIVENHTYPIASVEVETDRGWLQASREEFNFWLPPGGNMGTGNVRITDINGSVVTGSVAPAGGSAPQLMCQ